MTPWENLALVHLLVALAFAVTCAAADWIRGLDKGPALAKKFLYAMVASFLVVDLADGYWGLVFFIVFIGGASYGWGRPLGLTLGGENDPAYERWQVGILRDTRYALVARGFMWLGPIMPLYIVTDNTRYLTAPLAMTVAFVAAPYIARLLPFERPWKGMEITRGGLFGLLAYGGGLL